MLQGICITLFFIGFTVAILAIVGMQFEGQSRASRLKWTAGTDIDTWAKENGLEIKVSEKKTYYLNGRVGGNSGPFRGRISEGQHVYRVVVTNIGDEKRRVAWIRLGKDVWGNTPDDFKVIWEDEWRPSEPPIEGF